MENKSKNQVENTDSVNKKILLSDIINNKLNEYYKKRYKAEQNFNNQYYSKRMKAVEKRLNKNFISDILNLFN